NNFGGPILRKPSSFNVLSHSLHRHEFSTQGSSPSLKEFCRAESNRHIIGLSAPLINQSNVLGRPLAFVTIYCPQESEFFGFHEESEFLLQLTKNALDRRSSI